VGGGTRRLCHRPSADSSSITPAADERGDRGDTGDGAHGAEGVSVQKKPAQRLTLNIVFTVAASLVSVGLAWAWAAELRVGLAAADLVQVHGDEVIGVDLGLGTGGQLLAGILRIAAYSGPAVAGLPLGGK
jgi:hypothetical protein